jgi:hypothetical protein
VQPKIMSPPDTLSKDKVSLPSFFFFYLWNISWISILFQLKI